MALEVGAVVATLGYRVEGEEKVTRYERKLEDAERRARRGINTKVDVDTRDADRGFDRYERRIEDADRKNKRFGAGIAGMAKSAGPALGALAAVGGTAFLALAKSATDAASDINESLTKNRVLFGDHAKEIERFSQSSARSLGISRQAALEYTGVFGNLARATGIGREESAKLSVRLTKLAADMASFNNTSIEDALDALRSGLVGETEPLRKFGVTLSANAIAAEAMRGGIVKVKKETLEYRTASIAVEKAQAAQTKAIKEHGKESLQAREASIGLEKANQNLVKVARGGKVELTAQQKALATTALVFRQTRAAQGDFARTSEGAANQQRILRARLADLQAQMGDKLLPVQLKLISATNRLLDTFAGGGEKTRALSRALAILGNAIELLSVPVRFQIRIVQQFGRIWGSVLSTALHGLELLARAAGHLPGVGDKFDGLANELRKSRRDVDLFRNAWRNLGRDQERDDSLDNQRRHVDRLRTRLAALRKGTSEYNATADDLRRAQRRLNDAMADAGPAGRKGGKGLQSLGSGAESASDAVAAAAATIADNVNRLARDLGAKGIKFTPAKTPKQRRTQQNVFGPPGEIEFQRGGMVPVAISPQELVVEPNGAAWTVPGARTAADSVHTALPEGSAVLTGHGQQLLARGASIAEALRQQLPHFAEGGIVGRITQLGRAIQRRGPYRVGEHPAFGGVAPVHAHYPPFDHYSGGALDVNADGAPGGEGPALDRLAAWLRRSGWHVLWRVKDHFDHLHVDASAGGQVRGGGPAAALARILLRGPDGALRRTGQAAIDRMRRGGNRYLEQAAPTEAGEPSPSRGGYSKARLSGLWTAAGGPRGVANLMAAIALAESGGNPTARNPSGASGLWQILGLPFPGDPFDPMTNARMAVSKYRSQGLGAWEAYTRGMHRQFLRGGGTVARTGKRAIQRINANPWQGVKLQILAGQVGDLAKGDMPVYDGLIAKAADLSRQYTIDDRAYGLDDPGELIDPTTGEINQPAIEKKAAQLEALGRIREAILAKLREAEQVAIRVRDNLVTMVNRLTRSLQFARGKTREGIVEKINQGRTDVDDWNAKLKDLGFQIQDAGLDVEEIRAERAEVLGTQARPVDAAAPSADTQAIIAQLEQRNTALTQDIGAARASLRTFTGAGDIGSGGRNAFASAAMAGPLGVGAAGSRGLFGSLAGGAASVVVNYHGFVPPRGEELQRLGSVVVGALDARPYRAAHRVRLGDPA